MLFEFGNFDKRGRTLAIMSVLGAVRCARIAIATSATSGALPAIPRHIAARA
jgi:hypothetical protein